MKRAVVVLGLVAAGCAPGTSSTPTAGAAMPAGIVEPYLKIETALASDQTDGIRMNAGDLATAATALGAPAFRIDTAAAQLAAATELPDARERFGTLSEAIVTYMDGLHLALPDGVRVAVCPTNQKPWLQQGAELSNPYYGPAMPVCGGFR